MRRVLVAALGLFPLPLLTPSALLAQGPGRPAAASPLPALPAGNGELRGTVVAAEGNAPVARAAIAVRRAAAGDSALVAGAIAGTDGSFVIRGMRPGAYTLRVTSM